MSSAPLPSTGASKGWRGIFTAERVALFLLILAAALPYLSSLTFGFVYDDLGVIVEVPSRHTWLGVAQAWVQSYWGNPETGLYRPVAQFMYALLWNLGGGKPWIFHLYAIVIHVATTLGLWWLLARATNKWAAFFGALLFAVDPVHVEAVANIVNSSEVLVAMFGIACIGVLLRASMKSDGGVVIGWKPALLAAGAYMLAIGAKESGAGIPAIAFLCLWGWRSESSGRQPTFREVLVGGWRVWSLCTVALVSVVTARFFVLGGLTVSQHWVTHEVRNFGFAPRFWTMTAAWPLIGRLLVWPSRLRMHYGSDIVIPLTEPTIWAVLSLAAAALIVIAAALLARRGDRRPLVSIAWVAIAFLPASNLLVPTGQLLAERTLYLPSVGIALLVAWGANQLYGAARDLGGAFAAKLVTGVPLAAIAVGGLLVTYPEVIPWQTNYTLFLHGIEQAPRASRPWQLMGDLYANKNEHQRAIKYLQRAHALEPGNDNIVFFYSEQLHAIGAYEGELALLRDASKENPGSEQTWVMYLVALGTRRGPDSVLAELARVPAHDSTSLNWHAVMKGEAYYNKDLPDSAIATYRQALVQQPHSGNLHYLLANMLRQTGKLPEATKELAIADSLKGGRPEAILRMRSEIALARGDSAAARKWISQAIRIAPLDSSLVVFQRTLGRAS
ncbi:MAG: tetratricopeptide repeat protein [Gemmatimonadaceae bacterium]|nr:tetratricopeptide repeat protein [Gemmatimonadaceae bacterium]